MLRIAVVPRIIDALLPTLALDACEATAEDRLDTNTWHIAGHTASTLIGIVHANMALWAGNRADTEATAGLIGVCRLWHFCRRGLADSSAFGAGCGNCKEKNLGKYVDHFEESGDFEEKICLMSVFNETRQNGKCLSCYILVIMT